MSFTRKITQNEKQEFFNLENSRVKQAAFLNSLERQGVNTRLFRRKNGPLGPLNLKRIPQEQVKSMRNKTMKVTGRPSATRWTRTTHQRLERSNPTLEELIKANIEEKAKKYQGKTISGLACRWHCKGKTCWAQGKGCPAQFHTGNAGFNEAKAVANAAAAKAAKAASNPRRQTGKKKTLPKLSK